MSVPTEAPAATDIFKTTPLAPCHGKACLGGAGVFVLLGWLFGFSFSVGFKCSFGFWEGMGVGGAHSDV